MNPSLYKQQENPPSPPTPACDIPIITSLFFYVYYVTRIKELVLTYCTWHGGQQVYRERFPDHKRSYLSPVICLQQNSLAGNSTKGRLPQTCTNILRALFKICDQKIDKPNEGRMNLLWLPY